MTHFGEGWQRRPRSRNEPFRTPDMWPFLGITVVLFVTLMVGEHRPHGVVNVDLVRSEYARELPWATRKDAIRVEITRYGMVSFANMRVQADDLPGMIRNSLRAGAEKRVYVRVDSRVQYGDLRVVLNAVSSAGVENVSFLTN